MVVFAKFNDRRGPLPREIRRRCSVEWSLEKPCPHPLGITGQVGSAPRGGGSFSQRYTPRGDAERCPVGPRGGRAASASSIPAGWLSPITPHPPQCLGTACIGGRGVCQKDSPHIIFWSRAKETLTYMRFASDKTREQYPPSLKKNWKTTIESFEELFKTLETYNVRKFKPRYINQNVIEHFFGRIRSYNYRNINPSARQFSATYKTLSINNLTSYRSVKINCKKESNESLAIFFRTICDRASTNQQQKK